MRRSELRYLVGTQICGAEMKGHRLCLLRPDHDGEHSSNWPRGPLSREDRIERDLAKERVWRIRRGQRIVRLRNRIEILERQRARDRAYLGFRIQFRIRGALNRLRRYRRLVFNRTIRRALGTWPPR